MRPNKLHLLSFLGTEHKGFKKILKQMVDKFLRANLHPSNAIMVYLLASPFPYPFEPSYNVHSKQMLPRSRWEKGFELTDFAVHGHGAQSQCGELSSDGANPWLKKVGTTGVLAR